MVRTVGYWWSCRDIEIVEIEGRYIALSDWNGESYLDCWEVKSLVDGIGFDIIKDGIIARPVYSDEELELLESGEIDTIEPINYELEEWRC